MRGHPRYSELHGLLQPVVESILVPCQRMVYRCVELQWARPEYLVSGEGTRKRGGRWMRPGFERVVHASLSESLALKESRRGFDYYHVRCPKQTPRVSVQIAVDLRRVADLKSIEERTPWPKIDELLAEDWMAINRAGVETLSQALGRVLLSLEVEGLLVSSVRDRRGVNIAWFPDHLHNGSTVAISGQEELASWLRKNHM